MSTTRSADLDIAALRADIEALHGTELSASLAGASLASGGWSSPPGHRNGAWGALSGVRPGGCGVTLLKLTKGDS